MRAAKVFFNSVPAGILKEEDRNNYTFSYDDAYFNNTGLPAVSLTLPKTKLEYHSEFLFPFFYNMLAEGANKKLQSLQLKIDENDAFGLLLATAGFDTIGAITIKPIVLPAELVTKETE
jgi:serine/threonine-protein kinase HipA